jgi:ornithine cyclodeaminase/alanine dehydrogenase-like protein (mu-crystallin family)
MPTLLVLGDSDIRSLLDPDALLTGLAEGFCALSQGRTVAPHRSDVAVPGRGFLLIMPAWQAGSRIAVKMVAVFRENAESRSQGHPALISLFDPDTGDPVAIMDGRYLTTMRTAGAAALSVRHLARPEARVLAVIGTGSQGKAHLETVTRVRSFAEVRTASRTVGDIEAAVRGADVVCLCTNSGSPVIDWNWIGPGVHISSIGYAAPGSELPSEAVGQGRI